jgi:7-cyano-7-deazaguanine reductase
MPVKLLGKESVVESTNVLKPANLIFVRRIENPSIDYNIILGIILLSGDILMKLHSKILDTFENPETKEDYLITMDIPEFTCLCPLTGQPDFAEFVINYVPDKLCVELKSLKLYMGSYRDVGAFHEDNTNSILKDIRVLIKPRYMSVIGYWKVRGGITTTISTKYIKKGWKDNNNILV